MNYALEVLTIRQERDAAIERAKAAARQQRDAVIERARAEARKQIAATATTHAEASELIAQAMVDRDREIHRLREVQSMSVREIAAQVGCSPRMVGLVLYPERRAADRARTTRMRAAAAATRLPDRPARLQRVA